MKHTTYKLDSIIDKPEELREVLKLLPIGKAAGPKLMNNRRLKEIVQPLTLPLCDLFNCSLSSRNLPNILKQAKVTPIYKKNNPSNMSNYRHISFLSTVSKVKEKSVHKYLFNIFRDNNVITTFRWGFDPGYSTVNQLIDTFL